MIFNSLALTLLAATGLIYMYTKVRNGEHGKMLKWVTFLLLLVVVGSVAWLVCRGAKKYWHHQRGEQHQTMSCHPSGDNHKEHCGSMDMRNGCGQDKKHGKGAKECCGREHMMMRENETDSVMSEISTDTIDGKIIHKETTIIRNKKP